jgi:hypothetical protein
MSHPWFRVALVTLLALTDLIVYFYETGRTMGSEKLFLEVLLLTNRLVTGPLKIGLEEDS